MLETFTAEKMHHIHQKDSLVVTHRCHMRQLYPAANSMANSGKMWVQYGSFNLVRSPQSQTCTSGGESCVCFFVCVFVCLLDCSVVCFVVSLVVSSFLGLCWDVTPCPLHVTAHCTAQTVSHATVVIGLWLRLDQNWLKATELTGGTQGLDWLDCRYRVTELVTVCCTWLTWSYHCNFAVCSFLLVGLFACSFVRLTLIFVRSTFVCSFCSFVGWLVGWCVCLFIYVCPFVRSFVFVCWFELGWVVYLVVSFVCDSISFYIIPYHYFWTCLSLLHLASSTKVTYQPYPFVCLSIRISSIFCTTFMICFF